MPRLVWLFVLTVLGGVVATMLAPTFATAYAQSAPPATLAAASYPRAVSAPPVPWTRAVATRALVRGDTLRADDIAIVDTMRHGRLPYGVDTTMPRAGWLVQRAIAAGEWLRAPGVAPQPAVTAGRPVTAIWSDGAVRVSVSAVALSSAPIGAAVTVRVGRNRRLDAVVVAPDSVRLR
jgi:flagella basal body P-ring formation protein FlgA